MMLFSLILVLCLYLHMLEIDGSSAPSPVPAAALLEWNAYIIFTALWKGWVSQEINRGREALAQLLPRHVGRRGSGQGSRCLGGDGRRTRGDSVCRAGGKGSPLRWGTDCLRGWRVMDLKARAFVGLEIFLWAAFLSLLPWFSVSYVPPHCPGHICNVILITCVTSPGLLCAPVVDLGVSSWPGGIFFSLPSAWLRVWHRREYLGRMWVGRPDSEGVAWTRNSNVRILELA